MTTINHQERRELQHQLAEVTHLRLALKAFRQVDSSLNITLGPDWLDSAHMTNVIADINTVLVGHLVPDATGKLVSIFRQEPRP